MRSTLALLAMTTVAQADGIAIAPADPCWTDIFSPAIVEVDAAAQADLWAFHCGRIPSLVALDQNYVAGHPTMFWDQPPLLPQEPPAPVPLPAAGWMMLAALGALAMRRKV